jgi:CubicO group peptidase (beta-lactamase class C family)
MQYDTVGSVQINSISNMLNAAIAQCPDVLGADLEAFTKKFLYQPLGMSRSTWTPVSSGSTTGSANKTFAYTWNTDLLDMARVGLLILNRGVWNGKRIVSEEWIYRMTHPSFEDANTGYGYLTWLNASSNYTMGQIPITSATVPTSDDGKYQEAYSPGTCAPVSVYKAYPHGLSENTDCNYKAPATCAQQYDVGVWQAVGLQGQLIQGHPGLDMVIVARNLMNLDRQNADLQMGTGGPKLVWDNLRAAVIAGDPKYKGDEAAFCAAYGSNNYAPDAPELRLP